MADSLLKKLPEITHYDFVHKGYEVTHIDFYLSNGRMVSLGISVNMSVDQIVSELKRVISELDKQE